MLKNLLLKSYTRNQVSFIVPPACSRCFGTGEEVTTFWTPIYTQLSALMGSAPTTRLVEDYIMISHDFANIPWAVTPLLAGVFVRILCIGFDIGAQKQYRKNLILRELNLVKMKEIEKLVFQKYANDKLHSSQLQALADKKKSEYTNFVESRYGTTVGAPQAIHILTSVAFLSTSFAVRNFLTDPRKFFVEQNRVIEDCLSFCADGILWIPSMVHPDPHLILSGSLAFCMMIHFQLKRATMITFKDYCRANKMSLHWFFNIPLYIGGLAMGAMVITSAYIPSGITLCWLGWYSVSMLITMLLNFPKMRIFLKFPPLPFDTNQPIRQFLRAFRR